MDHALGEIAPAIAGEIAGGYGLAMAAAMNTADPV